MAKVTFYCPECGEEFKVEWEPRVNIRCPHCKALFETIEYDDEVWLGESIKSDEPEKSHKTDQKQYPEHLVGFVSYVADLSEIFQRWIEEDFLDYSVMAELVLLSVCNRYNDLEPFMERLKENEQKYEKENQ